MTQSYPPSQYPQAPQGYPYVYPGQGGVGIPTGVKVTAVIGIIIAALYLLCGAFSLIGNVGNFEQEAGMENPIIQAASDPQVRFYNAIGNAVTVFSGLLLMVFSIASLRLAGWARKGMFLYAFLEILNTIFGMVVFVVVALPKLSEAMAPAAGNQATMTTALAVVGILARCIWLILPLMIFITFNRPAAIAAFSGQILNPYGQYPYPQQQYPQQGYPPQYPQQQYPSQQWPPDSPFNPR